MRSSSLTGCKSRKEEEGRKEGGKRDRRRKGEGGRGSESMQDLRRRGEEGRKRGVREEKGKREGWEGV